MKYFTKQWYELCQAASYHLRLEEDERAEAFSEEYFHQLYNTKLAEFLDSWKEVVGITHEPYNRELLCKQFEAGFIYNQDNIKRVLPEKILKMIADIRVYVLDKASGSVIKEVTEFCENNRRTVERTVEEYNKYYKEALKSFDEAMIGNIHFHDCVIIEMMQSEQSLSILFDNSGGFTNTCEMKLENYEILKQEAPLQGAWWLYDEIYKIDNKYELQVLLQDKNSDLVEFTVYTESFDFKRNKHN